MNSEKGGHWIRKPSLTLLNKAHTFILLKCAHALRLLTYIYMCVCVCVRTHVSTHNHTQTITHTHKHPQTHPQTHTNTPTNTHTLLHQGRSSERSSSISGHCSQRRVCKRKASWCVCSTLKCQWVISVNHPQSPLVRVLYIEMSVSHKCESSWRVSHPAGVMRASASNHLIPTGKLLLIIFS